MSWSAGFGRGVISPPVPVFLAGFGARTLPAEAIHDDLEARALYLSDGSTAACLIVCDLLGMSPEFSDPIRDAVGAALDLPRAAVLISCVHTHAGPNAMRGAEAIGWATPDGYAEILTDGCLAAARGARAAAEAAELSVVRAPLPEGLSVNRRGLPYEPSFAALDVRRPGGGRIGVVANLAIHPVALTADWLEVSSDWVAPFREAVESQQGGMAIMLSGALGDVNPARAEPSYEVACDLGVALADTVGTALGTAAPAGDGLRTASRVIHVTPGATPLRQLLGLGENVAVELVEWAIGAVSLVAVPGEAFHALERRIVAAREGEVLLAGLAPSWHGYLPEPYGVGYEEQVSLGADAVAAIADALVEGVPA